jgi:hypothetical protein
MRRLGSAPAIVQGTLCYAAAVGKEGQWMSSSVCTCCGQRTDVIETDFTRHDARVRICPACRRYYDIASRVLPFEAPETILAATKVFRSALREPEPAGDETT